MKSLYAILMIATLSFPLWKSFDPRLKYSSKWIALFPAISITAIFFLIWDVQFTRMGVWGFNDSYTSSLYFLNLPIEEWMFFIVVPFACVFIYEVVIYYFPNPIEQKTARVISLLSAISLLILAGLHIDEAYTFWSLSLTGLFLLFISWLNPMWMGHFFLAYLFHLIPFLIINGILTGAFTAEPVVWYNNAENLGIRLVSIPIEDSIYSLLLLLMNITLYEYFKKARITKPKPAL